MNKSFKKIINLEENISIKETYISTQEKIFDRHTAYKETYEISHLGILILRKIGELVNE